jgi:hypothetical protein
LDPYLGCLLGGAVGNARGAPVEFLSLEQIRRQFGDAGRRDFAPAYGRLGAIIGDTQMSLCTSAAFRACRNPSQSPGRKHLAPALQRSDLNPAASTLAFVRELLQDALGLQGMQTVSGSDIGERRVPMSPACGLAACRGRAAHPGARHPGRALRHPRQRQPAHVGLPVGARASRSVGRRA